MKRLPLILALIAIIGAAVVFAFRQQVQPEVAFAPTAAPFINPTVIAKAAATSEPTAIPTSRPARTAVSILPTTETLGSEKEEWFGLGVMQPNEPWGQCEGYKAFIAETGANLKYAHWFQAWGNEDSSAYRPEWVECVANLGATPIISWEPWVRQHGVTPVDAQPEFSMSAIARGEQDEYIRSWAKGMKLSEVEIYVRFAHEMDTPDGLRNWYPWQGSPSDYVAAYRHIVTLFRKEGATNVRWIWSPIDPSQAFSRQYYPGDDYVDALSTTIINFGEMPDQDWMKWNTFVDMMDQKYKGLARYGKPIILTEVESNEGKKGQKAAWIAEMFQSIIDGRYPLVTALVWFNVEKDHSGVNANWAIHSSPDSLKAFQEGITLLRESSKPRTDIPTPLT